MQVKVQSWRRLNAGLLFVTFGLAGVWFARNLQFGTPASMGPGFLPMVCSWLIVALGLVVVTQSFFDDVEVMEPPLPRPIVMISLAVALFALLIERAGLGITAFITAFVSSYAGPARLVETLILSLGAAVGAAIVFVVLLGLNIPVWPGMP